MYNSDGKRWLGIGKSVIEMDDAVMVDLSCIRTTGLLAIERTFARAGKGIIHLGRGMEKGEGESSMCHKCSLSRKKRQFCRFDVGISSQMHSTR